MDQHFYIAALLDGVITKIKRVMQNALAKIQKTLMQPEVKKAGKEQIKEKARESIREKLAEDFSVCHDPLLRGAIRLNLLTDRVDIVRDLGWSRNTSALTDTDVKYLPLYFEQNYGLTSEKKMTAALPIVANENCYHPIQDVLNGFVWDGTPPEPIFCRCGRRP